MVTSKAANVDTVSLNKLEVRLDARVEDDRVIVKTVKMDTHRKRWRLMERERNQERTKERETEKKWSKKEQKRDMIFIKVLI